MIVVKFAGSVQRDATSLVKIYEAISKEKSRELVIVVSAFYGITDKLIECANNIIRNNDITSEIIEKHQDIMESGGIRKNLLNDLFEEFLKAIESVKIYRELNAKILDYIMAFGERFSCRIISEYLNNNGMKTHYFEGHQIGLVTNSDFGKATPLPTTYTAIPSFFREINCIPVIAGFISKDINGNYTTLGRNGSDYTAAIISYACNAECLKIYSNVNGILSGNPHFIKNAKAIDELSLSEYQELQYWLKRIHSHMLGNIVEKNIPLLLLNINNPDFAGTKISHKSAECVPKIIVFRDDIFINTIEIPTTSSYLKVAKMLINYLDENNTYPLWLDIRNTQILTIISNEEKVSDLINTFSKHYIIYTHINKVAVKVIGENMGNKRLLYEDILGIARRHNISLNFIFHPSQAHSSIFIIEKSNNFIEFLNDLHDNIILR